MVAHKAAALAAVAVALALASTAALASPNVIIFMTDDQVGYLRTL